MNLLFKIVWLKVVFSFFNIYCYLAPDFKITLEVFNLYKQEQKQIVAVGLIINPEGKILLVQRNFKTTFPGKWSLVGGKIEVGENLYECLRREILEEVQLDAKIGGLFDIIHYNYRGLNLELYFFKITEFAGNVKLNNEHINFAWVTPLDLEQYDLIETNLQLIEKFRA